MKDRMGKTLSISDVLTKSMKRAYNIVLDLELMILNIVSSIVPLHIVRRLFYRASGVKIGKNSFIHMGARFYYPPGVEIGTGTVIGDHCFMDGRAPLIIGNHVDIASQVLIYNSEHDVDSEGFDPIEEAVEIGDYVFIGPRAVILPGVKVGRGAVIGAGAVVTKNVEEFSVVGGIPAKVIGERKNKDPHYKLGRARLFQ